MRPVATMAGGVSRSLFNVCWKFVTPVARAPIPFPSAAELEQARYAEAASKVKIQNSSVILVDMVIPITKGDAPSDGGGGLVSATKQNVAKIVDGSRKVLVGGKGVAALGSMVTMNNGNCLGRIKDVKQDKVQFTRYP